MKYHFKIHREGRGFWAECLEIKGCVTQADSERELTKNMREALNLILDEPPESKLSFSLPKYSARGPKIVSIEVEPRIAFAFYLRRLRIKSGLTQKEAAKRMGFKNIYSYQRLEKSQTANPELSTIVQIKRVFPEFNLEEILAA